VNVEVDTLHIKKIDIDDLVSYVYIVRLDVLRRREDGVVNLNHMSTI
jgi:hypothetical protein